jgi:hypothetical protein
MTYEEKSLGRLQMLCDNGTRAVLQYTRTLDRREPTMPECPWQTCSGRVNPRTQQWEGRWR